MKTHCIKNLPLNKKICSSCPFKLDKQDRFQNMPLANIVIERNLFKSRQICHSTEGPQRQPKTLCKGYDDYAQPIYSRLNLKKP